MLLLELKAQYYILNSCFHSTYICFFFILNIFDSKFSLFSYTMSTQISLKNF